MLNSVERAANLLFPESGPQTLNIKFSCGGDDNVSAEQLAEQVLRAESQIATGQAKPLDCIEF